MENIKQQLSLRFKSIVEAQCKKIKAPIFIVSGLTDYIDFSAYEDHIADPNTF